MPEDDGNDYGEDGFDEIKKMHEDVFGEKLPESYKKVGDIPDKVYDLVKEEMESRAQQYAQVSNESHKESLSEVLEYAEALGSELDNVPGQASEKINAYGEELLEGFKEDSKEVMDNLDELTKDAPWK